MKKLKQNIIALIYDFDGTLSPKFMQEYTVLPKIGITAKEFWDKVNKETKQGKAEPMLTYLRVIVEEVKKRGIKVTRADYRKLANNIEYFKGVEKWFKRINAFVEESAKDIEVRHYIISAGMLEILEGVSIAKEFERIYASEFHYNKNGLAEFPKVFINDTIKTQFIFRINKGKENLDENINTHDPKELRPIPFENIVYFGDGQTDVPSFSVVRKNGGYGVAVYNEANKKGLRACKELLKDKRVTFIAKADYRANEELDKRVKFLLKAIISKIEFKNYLEQSVD